ncbi:AbrB family transcriptional regulator [Sulfolobus sp. A20]|uniref:AbrB/MazE/SpoVT family DNA-binding domain-containing protein n=1 Tax=Sulfolobaceae TaxID=118883 RepID=UPI000845E0EB|nr:MULTISPECIES: AbrB/MazE/SpoVT family DNA-binding domain-containing protein [unclassified Sulfolobus]TRM74538.1 AbrB/MazE/SpoVT family DNA-binding domain-containing protein [Sulfolobus sp. A20-N-F8]TRM76532.1 AbrB/MazE/SpoVT family DNA-binding domain-containing protein [Sulfolobus sp. E5]TRM78988.1 AbrB/MazE/SpoVT family DNA-binding domain-containing protein [Sulfolobus sp. B5]TRM81178.1 AbrB/MazE/SpoVT family DNA-binding domain-containing protein [Sulfolobus sp. D5]TRM84795.1 AbrB/MazE/SpoV
MERVKVTRNYQITIPSAVRETLGIKEGDILEVYVEGDRIVIKKVKSKRPRIRLNKPVTLEYIDESVERGMHESLG